MRITEAARRLGTSPRMLRYRDQLGLLPQIREWPAQTSLTKGDAAARHRRFQEADLSTAALALDIEQRYDVSPAALAFAVKVLSEPRVRADVAELGRRIGRIAPPPARALEFEKERALRLLGPLPGSVPTRRRQ